MILLIKSNLKPDKNSQDNIVSQKQYEVIYGSKFIF